MEIDPVSKVREFFPTISLLKGCSVELGKKHKLCLCPCVWLSLGNSPSLNFEVAQKPDKLCKRSRSRNGVFNDSHSMFHVSVSGEPDV